MEWNSIKKVAFVTGSRADYGIMRNFLKKVDADKEIDFKIIVTGALLDDNFGRQVQLIYEDGFAVSEEISVPLETKTNRDVLHTMSIVMDKFAAHFFNYQYDLVILLGDRYEMLSVAISAAMQKIPILHLHGGEATFGNYDEFIRHCITKMSDYHFTTTEEYRKRVIQLGEHPSRVYNMGALGAENCTMINMKNVPEEVRALKNYFVVLFHPETLTNIDVDVQINRVLKAVETFNKYNFVFLGTNADTGSEKIREKVKTYVEKNKNTVYFENLHTDAFHYLLKESNGLIGNSSSGIIEAPSLNIYTINIGDRQKGRTAGNSVIHVKCEEEDIKKAIQAVLMSKKSKQQLINPYYKPDSANLYYLTLKKILAQLENDNKKEKEFYDLNF